MARSWLPALALLPLLYQEAKVPVRLRVGSVAPDFVVKSLDGKDKTSAVLREEKKPKILVLVFWSHTCPWSRAWDGELTKIAKDYEGKNVRLIGIDSNDPGNKDGVGNSDSAKDIERYHKEKALGFEVYTDASQKVANAFGAQTTPDVFVIGVDGKIAYTGRVNDMQNFAKPSDFKKSYLRDALDALVAGKAATEPLTPPSGCGIRKTKP